VNSLTRSTPSFLDDSPKLNIHFKYESTGLKPFGPANMVSDNLKSPNVIPPRTSSHGIVTNGQHVSSVKPVLRPLSEIDWIAQGKKHTLTVSHTHSHPASMSTTPPDPLMGIGDDLIHQKQATWSEEKEKILLGPYDYLYGHPGKDIRSQLIAAFNEWLNVPAESLEIITKVVGMLHTASLLYA